MNVVNKLFIYLILFQLPFSATKAQETWPSPEVEQMHRHALEYMAMKNYKDAITTFKQLLTFTPDKILVITELGNCYYLTGDYIGTIEILKPIITKKEVTEQVYQLLAASYTAQKHYKDAKKIISKGLRDFPKSGLLFYQEGCTYKVDKDNTEALAAWREGIRLAPDYALNYREAAIIFLDTDINTESVLWGLLDGETYLDLKHDTTNDDTLKLMIYAGWKTFFDNLSDDHSTNNTPFDQAVKDIYKQLTPVVSDGVTTENLTMVRTRFLMEWFRKHNEDFSYFGLFKFHDELLRNGWFDIYNEWLFGYAEDKAQYQAWMQFHEGDMAKFEEWKKKSEFKPFVQIGTD